MKLRVSEQRVGQSEPEPPQWWVLPGVEVAVGLTHGRQRRREMVIHLGTRAAEAVKIIQPVYCDGKPSRGRDNSVENIGNAVRVLSWIACEKDAVGRGGRRSPSRGDASC